MEKLHGELQLSAVTTVDIPPHIKGSQFPFALHFIGKGSPWVINAYSEVRFLNSCNVSSLKMLP